MKNPIALFGIPITACDQKENAKILLEQVRKGDHAQYACSVSCQKILSLQRWNFMQNGDLEQIQILRNSLVVCPSGPLCIFYGGKKGKKPGWELFHQIGKELGREQRKVFLLGLEEYIADRIALDLTQWYPGLKVVTSRPFIETEGEGLVNAPDRDMYILEEINQEKPDVLLLALPETQREIWYNRVRKRLTCPLVIGVEEEGAPPSWIPSIRSLCDAIFLGLPIALYHPINFLTMHLMKHGPLDKLPTRHSLLFLSPKKSIALLPLPVYLSEQFIPKLRDQIIEAFSQDVVILDFGEVRHIDPMGICQIIFMIQQIKSLKKDFFILGMSADLRFLLRLHRVWDLVNPYLCFSPQDVIDELSLHGERQTLFETVQQTGESVTLTYFGPLDQQLALDAYMKKLTPMIQEKSVNINLKYCTRVDNRGVSLLLKIRELVENDNNFFGITAHSNAVSYGIRKAKANSLLP